MALPSRVPLHVRAAESARGGWGHPAEAASRRLGRLVKVCIPADAAKDVYNERVTLIEYIRQIPSRGASAVWVFGVHFPQRDN